MTKNSLSQDLVLEVKTQTSQTVYPPGNLLDLRLYSDREVEFDFYPPNTPDRIGMSFAAERKKSIVDCEEVDKILSLLDAPDVFSAKDYYGPTQRPLDATIKKTVTFKSRGQMKTIILEENDSHLHLEEKSNSVPESLIKLLEEVKAINKKLRKQINLDSR